MNEPALKYKWRITWPDEGDRDSWKTDFMGWDDDVPVGRIRLETANLMKGKWMWSGHGPRTRHRLLPHHGYSPTARLAAAAVEDYYGRLLAFNGISRHPQV